MDQNKSSSKSGTINRRTETRFRRALKNQSALILTAVVLVVGMSLNGTSQQTSSTSNPSSEESAPSCSLSETRTKDQISIKCQGMNPEQGERVSAAFTILPVMNKLLEDKLDPDVVTAKPGTGDSLVGPQFAISRLCETAKSWRSLLLNAEFLGCHGAACSRLPQTGP
jgi:hypothetical protein